MAKQKKIEIFAYLPPIQSAIMLSGDGDLLQFKLCSNLSISPDAIRISALTGKTLKVTIEESLTNLDEKGKTEHPHETKKSAKGSGSEVDRRRRTNRRDKR